MQWWLSVGGMYSCILTNVAATTATVFVCRYGGILLHGDRFKHINNVARILLLETGVGLEVNTERE